MDFPAFVKDGRYYYPGDCVIVGSRAVKRRWDMRINRIFTNQSQNVMFEATGYHSAENNYFEKKPYPFPVAPQEVVEANVRRS